MNELTEEERLKLEHYKPFITQEMYEGFGFGSGSKQEKEEEFLDEKDMEL